MQSEHQMIHSQSSSRKEKKIALGSRNTLESGHVQVHAEGAFGKIYFETSEKEIIERTTYIAYYKLIFENACHRAKERYIFERVYFSTRKKRVMC